MTVEPQEQTGALDEQGADGGDVEAPATGTASDSVPAPSWIQRCLARWRLITLALVAVAVGAVAVGYFFVQYRPNVQAGDAAEAAEAALQAAEDGTLALLNYTPDNFDAEMATAKSLLTGDFLTYYGKFTDEVMGPAVKQRGVHASAKLVRAALAELHPKSAVVLLFVDQSNASSARPEPGTAASGVRVTLTKVKDSWLISKFEPV